MASRNLLDLCPKLRDLAQEFLTRCQAQGIRVIITATYRSCAEQDADYAIGRTQPGRIITNAKGGQSLHNCVDDQGEPAARAFDFAIENADGTLNWNVNSTAWVVAITTGKALGLKWGGNFSMKDNDHFELPASA